MSNGSRGGGGPLAIVFGLAQLATYIMSAIRWFSTPYHDFWLGFKEMIWALTPVANFFYVWDWWAAAFAVIVAIGYHILHPNSD
jgi:hypothetical protein